MKNRILSIIVIIIFLSSCSVLKEYDKVYIYDKDMKLAERKVKKFETTFQVYREGASGANGGKSGGGCGCN